MNCLLGEAPSNSTTNKSSNSNTTTTTTQQQQASNKISLNISQSIGQETCLICGDVASGKHYGLRSCEACKAFFKRTVQGKIEYSCPATRECEINKRRRKACQACRFQKCLNMGMLKEGVRLDRVRGGRQKYRRGLSPGPVGGGSTSSGLVNGGLGSGNGSSIGGGLGGVTLTPGSSRHPSNQNSIIGSSTSVGSSNLGTNETNRIMTALINCEPEELSASPAQFVTNLPSSLSVQMKTLYILSDLFDRELVSLIGWAKQIPGFSETITLNDQMRLLQSTWAEVIALSIGYRSHLKRIENYRQQYGNGHHQGFMTATPSPTSSSPASTASGYCNNNNTTTGSSSSPSSYNLENIEIRLVFAKDLVIDFKHAVNCGAEEIFYNCVQLIKRLDYLKITPREYILLKAISLTNADVRLENPKATHQLRDSIMDTLYEATLSDALSCNNASSLSIPNMSGGGQRDDSGIDISFSNNTNHNHHLHHQVKIEAQERPLSSTLMHQYASNKSPPRPSPSLPSSLSPVSSNNNNNNNTNNVSLDNNNVAANSKKIIINHRLNQLLLCLPVLRQIDSCFRKFWNDVRKGPNNVPMNKLFEEMLEPCQRVYKSSAEM